MIFYLSWVYLDMKGNKLFSDFILDFSVYDVFYILCYKFVNFVFINENEIWEICLVFSV